MSEPMTGPERRRTLTEVFRELSRDEDPVRSVNKYSAAMRKLYGDQALVSVSLRGCPPNTYRVMRFLHQEGVVLEGMTDTLFAGDDAPVVSGGVLGNIVDKEAVVVSRNLNVANDPVLGNELSPYRALVAVPVFNAGKIMNYVIYLNTDPHAFSDNDIENLLLQANLMGGVTHSKRIVKELREATEWIHREVDEIASIQKGMIPAAMPAVEGLAVASFYETYDRAGGDYYSIFPLPGDEQEWGLFISDASGHGPSAAVVVAMISALLHSVPCGVGRAGEMLENLNSHFSRHNINNSFVTAFFAIYNSAERTLSYSSAGHPMPLLRDAAGRISALVPTGGVPLGVVDDYAFSDSRITLKPEQSLLLYTDGVTEAMGPGREQFDETRLVEAFAAAPREPESIIRHIVKRLRAHEDGNRPNDDQTMVVATIH